MSYLIQSPGNELVVRNCQELKRLDDFLGILDRGPRARREKGFKLFWKTTFLKFFTKLSNHITVQRDLLRSQPAIRSLNS